MPLSLQLRKELGKNGIDWREMHLADVLSIFYSLRIDGANEWLEYHRREEMQKRGIFEIKMATEDDFNAL